MILSHWKGPCPAPASVLSIHNASHRPPFRKPKSICFLARVWEVYVDTLLVSHPLSLMNGGSQSHKTMWNDPANQPWDCIVMSQENMLQTYKGRKLTFKVSVMPSLITTFNSLTSIDAHSQPCTHPSMYTSSHPTLKNFTLLKPTTSWVYRVTVSVIE